MAKKGKGKRKKKTQAGCLFWLIFLTVIAVVFFLKRETIASVLEKTRAKNILFKENSNIAEKTGKTDVLPELQVQDTAERPSDGQNGNNTGRAAFNGPEYSTDIGGAVSTAAPANPPDGSAVKEPVKNDTALAAAALHPEQGTVKPLQQSATGIQESENQPAMRNTAVYFIKIDDDGRISRQKCERMLPKSDSPMSDALEALFNAPTAKEANQGLRSLIPLDTKLRSAWVKDGVAFISVSEEFQFNQYGIEGALAQLAQIVFTVSEFPTVKSVQFLIEGKKKDYLGAEGVWIGSPLSRNSF